MKCHPQMSTWQLASAYTPRASVKSVSQLMTCDGWGEKSKWWQRRDFIYGTCKEKQNNKLERARWMKCQRGGVERGNDCWVWWSDVDESLLSLVSIQPLCHRWSCDISINACSSLTLPRHSGDSTSHHFTIAFYCRRRWCEWVTAKLIAGRQPHITHITDTYHNRPLAGGSIWLST